MMGKNKKPSEYQITKNLRLYRCPGNKNAKSSLEGDTVHSGDTVTLSMRRDHLLCGIHRKSRNASDR